MKPKYLFSVISLFTLVILLIPGNGANALVSTALPPADMFQLPWQQGEAWVALDGLDNGTKRPQTSSHTYENGGALDFTPNKDVKIGDDTSNFWVTAAAAGTVIVASSCHLNILHEGGWITEYRHLGNIQVNLGEAVYRNQRLGVIHNNDGVQVCPGNTFPYPHLHFSLRPTVENVTFAGWLVEYSPTTNSTTFSKNGQSIETWSFQPILNVPNLQIALREPLTWNTVYTGSLDAYRYERWPLTLTESQTFTVNAMASTPGLIPVIVLQDANGNEIARGTGSLTSTQPVGTYYVQVQPEAGQGFYYLLLQQDTGSGDSTPTPTTDPGGPTPTLTTDPGGPTPTPTTDPGGPTPTPTTDPGGPTPTPTTDPGGPTPTPTTDPGGPTPTPTTDPGGPTLTPTTDPGGPTPTPTTDPNDPATTIDTPGSVGVGETILVTVYLNNVPPSGYASAEFTCTYPPDLVAVSNILVTDLFGTDPAVAIFGPQGGSFLVAIAGSNGQRAVTSGAVFSFNVTGLQAGQATIACVTRVSTGDGVLTVIDSVTADITIGGDPTPAPTSTPDPGTASPILAGQVLASKPVTVSLYDAGNALTTSVVANVDGTFSLTAPVGIYTVVATASGFLSAQGPVTLTAGATTTKATVSLFGGDIDGNSVIDQYDAMTIGMNYNAAIPDAADLNADGTVNVLDLEILASNYRRSGALSGQ